MWNYCLVWSIWQSSDAPRHPLYHGERRQQNTCVQTEHCSSYYASEMNNFTKRISIIIGPIIDIVCFHNSLSRCRQNRQKVISVGLQLLGRLKKQGACYLGWVKRASTKVNEMTVRKGGFNARRWVRRAPSSARVLQSYFKPPTTRIVFSASVGHFWKRLRGLKNIFLHLIRRWNL